MRWPANRRFVDKNGDIVDPWFGPLKRLEQLLDLTPEQYTRLLALLQPAEDDGESDALDLALTIDTEPLFSEDYLIEYKNSAQAGRRVALSRFMPAPQLISTTSFSGNSSVDISIPSGYTDFELRVAGWSNSTNNEFTIGFSEDGGATLLTQLVDIFRNGAGQNGSVAGAGSWGVSGNAASENSWGRMRVFDYLSFTTKLVNEFGIRDDTPTAWTGSRLLTSTAPINLVRYGVGAGTFDAGTVELWGLP